MTVRAFITTPGVAASTRLFLFPYAGGSASAYRAWLPVMGNDVEVVRVQYPGRESRYAEPAHQRIDSLADAIASEFDATDHRPSVFFGHSMGALVAFEVAHRLPDPVPSVLVVSAALPPHWRGRQMHYSRMSTADLIQVLRDLGNDGADALADPDIADALLPTVKADLAAVETYRCAERLPLSCPIVAGCGETDSTISAHAMKKWHELTRASFALHRFAGGHFFPWENPNPVLALLRSQLADMVSAVEGEVSW